MKKFFVGLLSIFMLFGASLLSACGGGTPQLNVYYNGKVIEKVVEIELNPQDQDGGYILLSADMPGAKEPTITASPASGAEGVFEIEPAGKSNGRDYFKVIAKTETTNGPVAVRFHGQPGNLEQYVYINVYSNVTSMSQNAYESRNQFLVNEHTYKVDENGIVNAINAMTENQLIEFKPSQNSRRNLAWEIEKADRSEFIAIEKGSSFTVNADVIQKDASGNDVVVLKATDQINEAQTTITLPVLAEIAGEVEMRWNRTSNTVAGSIVPDDSNQEIISNIASDPNYEGFAWVKYAGDELEIIPVAYRKTIVGTEVVWERLYSDKEDRYGIPTELHLDQHLKVLAHTKDGNYSGYSVSTANSSNVQEYKLTFQVGYAKYNYYGTTNPVFLDLKEKVNRVFVSTRNNHEMQGDLVSKTTIDIYNNYATVKGVSRKEHGQLFRVLLSPDAENGAQQFYNVSFTIPTGDKITEDEPCVCGRTDIDFACPFHLYYMMPNGTVRMIKTEIAAGASQSIWSSAEPISENWDLYILASDQLAHQSVEGVIAKFVSVDNANAITSFKVNLKKSASQENFDEIKELQLRPDGSLAVDADPASPTYGQYIEVSKTGFVRVDSSKVGEKYTKAFRLSGQSNIDGLYLDYIDEDITVENIKMLASDTVNNSVIFTVDFSLKARAYGKTTQVAYAIKHENGGSTTSDITAGNEKFVVNIALPFTGYSIYPDMGNNLSNSITDVSYNGSDVASLMLKNSTLTPLLLSMPSTNGYVPKIHQTTVEYVEYTGSTDEEFEKFLGLNKVTDHNGDWVYVSYQDFIDAAGAGGFAITSGSNVAYLDTGKIQKDLTASISTRNSGYTYVILTLKGTDLEGNEKAISKVILVESYVAPDGLTIRPAANREISLYASDSVSNEYANLTYRDISIAFDNSNVTYSEMDKYQDLLVVSSKQYSGNDEYKKYYSIEGLSLTQAGISFKITALSTDGAAQISDIIDVVYQIKKGERVVYKIQTSIVVTINNAQRIENVSWKNYDSQGLYYEIGSTDTNRLVLLETTPTNAKDNSMYCLITDTVGNRRTDVFTSSDEVATGMFSFNLSDLFTGDNAKGMSGKIYILPQDAVNGGVLKYYEMTDANGEKIPFSQIESASTKEESPVQIISSLDIGKKYEMLSTYGYFKSTTEEGTKLVSLADIILAIDLEIADGSEEHPFRVFTPEQLIDMNPSLHYMVMNDIDLSSSSYTPVDHDYYDPDLGGVAHILFTGGLKGYNPDGSTTITLKTNVIVEDLAEGAYIKNLTFVGNVSTQGFVAITNEGTIDGVTVDTNGLEASSLNATGTVGGIVRENKGVIKNSAVLGLDITGTTVGGIAGTNSGEISNSRVEFYNLATTVVGGVATATETNSFAGSKVGGIVGKMTGGKIYRTYVYDYTLTATHNENGVKQPFVGDNTGFSGEIDYVFAVVGLDSTSVPVKNNNYYVGYYNASDIYTINNTNSDAFTLNAQISANFMCPTFDNGTENTEFDASINDGQAYFKDFYQPKGLSASEIADVNVRDFEENNFYKSIFVADNKGIIFFYQLTIDEETLSSSEKIDYTQMNTIALADLLGFNKSIKNVIVTSSDNKIVKPMGSTIVILSTGEVDITITAKQDVTVNKTISLTIVNPLTDLVISRISQDGKEIIVSDGNVIAIQKTTSQNVQVAQRTTSIYLGSLAALHNLAQPQWQLATKTEAVTGSLTEAQKVSALASDSFVTLVTTTNTSTDVGTKVFVYPQMTDLQSQQQSAIERIFTRQFVAQASDGVIFFEVSGEEFPISPSTKAVVKTRVETTFENDAVIPVVVYNGRAMQVEGSSGSYIFKDVLGNNVLLVTVGNKEVVKNTNPYVYVYDVTFSVHPDYQRRVAENMVFQVYFTSTSGNSSLVWGGQFDLVLSRQGFTNVDTSFVKVNGTYIEDHREVFKTDKQVSTLAPGNAAIFKVTVNPEFAYYDYAKVSFSGASVANPVVLDAVEVFDLAKGEYATLRSTTATTEREGTSLRYYPKAISDRLYFKAWINTTVEKDTTMKFTVAFYKNDQTEPLDYVNSYLEISYLAEPKVTINGEEIAFIAKGTTNEVMIQVREDQTVDSVDLGGDFGLEGVSLSSLSLPTIDSVKGIKTYVATLRCFVDAKSDTKNRFYITATVSRVLNGEKESKKTTATAVIVDFKIEDISIENANNSQFLAWQNISKRFNVTYNLLPEAYSTGEANQEMIDQLVANKEFFRNNHYYPKEISAAAANEPEYYINWLQDPETKEWQRQSTLDRLFVRSGGDDVHYANVDLPFSFTEDDETGLVQIKGSSVNTPPVTMVLYTYVYAGGVQTVIETEFVISVVAFSDPDLPLSIKSAADFLKLDPSRKQEGAVEGENTNRAPQDYILENDIVLENYVPFSTNLIRSLDGNGYTIYLKSFDLETPSNLKLALFDEVSDELALSEVNNASQTTLKNLRVNYYNGGQITVDISRHTSVEVAGIAITNSGIITNCDVVSFYETTLVGETITDIEPVLPCIQHAKTQGFNIAYRNGANTTEDSSLADNSRWSTSVAGFVLVNNGSITNSRVGGDEVILIDSVGVQDGIQTFAHTQTLGKFSIIAQGNVAGFVGTNNGNIASSYAKNIEIKNSSAATKYWTAGFVGVNNEDAAVITSYTEGVESPDTTNTAYLYANIGSTISSNMGYISGFTYENKGEIKDSYSNILIANSTTTDRVYLASGFVYTNEGMLENCYSAAQVANANYSQMNFSGVNTNGQLLANGTYENCYFYSAELFVEEKEDVYDDTTESQYKTGAKLIANPSIESSFYGFAIAETEQFFKDGIWKCSIEEGIRLIEPDYIAKSHRYKSYLPSSGDGDNEEYVLPYATLVVDGNSIYDTSLGGKHNPILIADAEDWQEISGTSLSSYVQMTFDENEIFGVYRVVNDIDFSVLKEELISTYKNFSGALYGNGFQLSNISLSQTNEEILENGTLSFGLFSTMSGPIVDKLKTDKPTLVLNVDMQINQVTAGLAPSVGGLAGIARGATLINIEIVFNEEEDSVIEGLNFAGGLVGFAYGENKIKNIIVKNPNVIADTFTEGDRDNYIKDLATFRGDVRNNVATALTSAAKDYSYAGAVIGYIDNYKSNEHSDDSFVAETKGAEVIYDINYIRVEGTVQVKAQVVGGVFGLSGYNTKVNDAVVTITAQEGKASRLISTRYFAGGLVGQAYGRFSRVYTVHDAETQKAIEDNMGSYYSSNNKSAERGVLDLFDTTNIDLDNKQVAVGGLFGYVGSGFLEVSYSKLNATSMSSQYAGGLIGMMDVERAETYTANADALYNVNEETRYFINEVFATGDVRASVMAGGLIGAIKGSNSKIKVLAANAVNYISTYDYATGGEATIDPNQFEISSGLKVNSFVGQFINVNKNTGVETVEKFVSRGTESDTKNSVVEFVSGNKLTNYITFTEATDAALNTGEALPSTARFRYYMFGNDDKAQKLYLKRFGEPFATDTAFTDGDDSTIDDYPAVDNSINSQGYAIYYNYAEDMTDEAHYIKQAETPAYFTDSAGGKKYTQSVFLNSGVWSYNNWAHPIDSLFPEIRSTETLDMAYLDLYNAAQVFEHMNNEGNGSTIIVRGLREANLDVEDPASYGHIEIAKSPNLDPSGKVVYYIANNGLGDIEKNQFHAIGSLREFTGRIIGGRYPETSLVKTQIISTTNFIAQLGEGASIIDQEFVFGDLPESHVGVDSISVKAIEEGAGVFVANELVKVSLTNVSLTFTEKVEITGKDFGASEDVGYEQNFGLVASAIVSSDIENLTINNAITNIDHSLLNVQSLTQAYNSGSLTPIQDETLQPDANGIRGSVDPYINVGIVAGKLINTSADDAMTIKGLAINKKSTSTGLISLNALDNTVENVNIGGFFGKITKAYEGTAAFIAEFAAPSWQGCYARIYAADKVAKKNLNIGGFVGHLKSCDDISTPEGKSLTSKFAYGLTGQYESLYIGNVIGLNQNTSAVILKGSVNDSADIGVAVAATDKWGDPGPGFEFQLDDETKNTNENFKAAYSGRPVTARVAAIAGIIGRQSTITTLNNFAKIDLKASVSTSGSWNIVAGYVGYSSTELKIENIKQSIVTGYVKVNGNNISANQFVSSVLGYTIATGNTLLFESGLLSTLNIDFVDVGGTDTAHQVAIFGNVLAELYNASDDAANVVINKTSSKMIAYNGTVTCDGTNTQLRFGGVIGSFAADNGSNADILEITPDASKNSFGGKVLVTKARTVSAGGSIGMIYADATDRIILRHSFNYGDVYIDYSSAFTSLDSYQFGGLIAYAADADYRVYTNYSAMTSHNARYLQSSNTAHALIGQGFCDGMQLGAEHSINWNGTTYWNNLYSHAVCLLNDRVEHGTDIGYNTGYSDQRTGFSRAGRTISGAIVNVVAGRENGADNEQCDIVQRMLTGLGVYQNIDTSNYTADFNATGNPFPVGHKLNPVVITNDINSTTTLGDYAGQQGEVGKHYHNGANHDWDDPIGAETITYQQKLDSLIGVGAYNFSDELIYYTLGNDISVTASVTTDAATTTRGSFGYSYPAAFIGDAFTVQFSSQNTSTATSSIPALFNTNYACNNANKNDFSFTSSLVVEVNMKIENATAQSYAALATNTYNYNHATGVTENHVRNGEDVIFYAINAYGEIEISGSRNDVQVAGLIKETCGKVSDCSTDIDITLRSGFGSEAYAAAFVDLGGAKTYNGKVFALVENCYAMGSVTVLNGAEIVPFVAALKRSDVGYYVPAGASSKNCYIENCYSATRFEWKDYLTVQDFGDLTPDVAGDPTVWKLGTTEKISVNTANFIDASTTAVGYKTDVYATWGNNAHNYTGIEAYTTESIVYNYWARLQVLEKANKDISKDVWECSADYNYYYPTLKYQYLKNSSFRKQTQVACDCGHTSGDCTTNSTYDCYIDNYEYTRLKNGTTAIYTNEAGANVTVTDAEKFYALNNWGASWQMHPNAEGANKNFVLICDIDTRTAVRNDSSNTPQTASWLKDQTFSGKFDGQGHTIKGLTSSLFDKITNGGYIKNLRLTDVNINQTALASGHHYYGIVANEIENATLSNITLNGNATYTFASATGAGDQPAIGSVAGRYDRINTGNNNVYYLSNIQSAVNITVDANDKVQYVDVGGIVGEANGSGSADNTKDSSNIYYCSNYGNINVYGKTTGPSKDHTAGGIVAYAKNVYIKHSYNAAAIWNGYDNGAASLKNGQGTEDILPGSFKTAGVAATIGNGTKSNIVGCYNTGMIKSGNKTSSTNEGVKSHAGGIVAYLESSTTSGNITNCYNEGSVEALAKNGTFDFIWTGEDAFGPDAAYLEVKQTSAKNVWVYGIGPDTDNTNIYKVEQDETGRTSILANGSALTNTDSNTAVTAADPMVYSLKFDDNANINDEYNEAGNWYKNYGLTTVGSGNGNQYVYESSDTRDSNEWASSTIEFTYKPFDSKCEKKPYEIKTASKNFLDLPTAIKYSIDYQLNFSGKTRYDANWSAMYGGGFSWYEFTFSNYGVIKEQFIKGINDLAYSKDGENILTSYFNAYMEGQNATQVFVNYTSETEDVELKSTATGGRTASQIIEETRTKKEDRAGISYNELVVGGKVIYLVENAANSIFTASLKTTSAEFKFASIPYSDNAMYSLLLTDSTGAVSFSLGSNDFEPIDASDNSKGTKIIVDAIYSNADAISVEASLSVTYYETKEYEFTSNLYVRSDGKIGLSCDNAESYHTKSSAWQTNDGCYIAEVDGKTILLTYDSGTRDFVFDPSKNQAIQLKDIVGETIKFVNNISTKEMAFTNNPVTYSQNITGFKSVDNLLETHNAGEFVTFNDKDMLVSGTTAAGYYTGGSWETDTAITSFVDEYLLFNTDVDTIKEAKEKVKYSSESIGVGESKTFTLDVDSGYTIDEASIKIITNADVTNNTTRQLSGNTITVKNDSSEIMSVVTIEYKIYKEYSSVVSDNKIKKTDFDAISGDKTYYYQGTKINSTVTQSSVYKIKTGYKIVRSSEQAAVTSKTVTLGPYSVSLNVTRSVIYETLQYKTYSINQVAYYDYQFKVADNSYPSENVYSLELQLDGNSYASLCACRAKLSTAQIFAIVYSDGMGVSLNSLSGKVDEVFDLKLLFNIHSTYTFDTNDADGLIDDKTTFSVEAYKDANNSGTQETSEDYYRFIMNKNAAGEGEQSFTYYMKTAGWYNRNSRKGYYLVSGSAGNVSFTYFTDPADTAKTYIWFEDILTADDELDNYTEYVAMSKIGTPTGTQQFFYKDQGGVEHSASEIAAGTTFYIKSGNYKLSGVEQVGEGLNQTKYYSANTFTEEQIGSMLLVCGNYVGLPVGYKTVNETGATRITQTSTEVSFGVDAHKTLTVSPSQGDTIQKETITVTGLTYFEYDEDNRANILVFAVAKNGTAKNGKQNATVTFNSTKNVTLPATTLICSGGTDLHADAAAIVLTRDVNLKQIAASSTLTLPIIGNGYNLTYYGASIFGASDNMNVRDINFLGEVNVMKTTQTSISSYFAFDDKTNALQLDNVSYYGNIHLRPRLFRTKNLDKIIGFKSYISSDMSLKYFYDDDNIVNLINVEEGASGVVFTNGMRIVTRNKEDEYIVRNGGELIFVDKDKSATQESSGKGHYNAPIEALKIYCCDKVTDATSITGLSTSNARSAVNVNVAQKWNNTYTAGTRELGYTENTFAGDSYATCRGTFSIKSLGKLETWRSVSGWTGLSWMIGTVTWNNYDNGVKGAVIGDWYCYGPGTEPGWWNSSECKMLLWVNWLGQKGLSSRGDGGGGIIDGNTGTDIIDKFYQGTFKARGTRTYNDAAGWVVSENYSEYWL